MRNIESEECKQSQQSKEPNPEPNQQFLLPKKYLFREIVAVYEKFIEISWKSYGETLLRDLLTDIVEVLTFDGGFLAWGK